MDCSPSSTSACLHLNLVLLDEILATIINRSQQADYIRRQLHNTPQIECQRAGYSPCSLAAAKRRLKPRRVCQPENKIIGLGQEDPVTFEVSMSARVYEGTLEPCHD